MVNSYGKTRGGFNLAALFFCRKRSFAMPKEKRRQGMTVWTSVMYTAVPARIDSRGFRFHN